MTRIFIILLIAGAALFALPAPSVSQCSNRVALTDSTYIRCGGKTYSDCEVELEVNQSGFWLNKELIVPFVQLVDKLSDTEKNFYRSTNVYRRAAEFGATDRQGLVAAYKAELSAIDQLRELTAGVHSEDELQSRMPDVLADSLVYDFIADVIWAEDIGNVGYRSTNGGIFVVLGDLCGVSSGGGPNFRDWDEYLPYLIETYCKQVESAKRLETVQTFGSFVAVFLGEMSGHMSYRSKAELLEELEKY